MINQVILNDIWNLVEEYNMNKEQQELVDRAYNNFTYNPAYKAEGVADLLSSQAGQLVKCPTQEDFINKIKTHPKFSEKWELKIEERELSELERRDIAKIKLNRKEWIDVIFLAHFKETYDKYNIPTRLITITYNDKTIESYE